MNAFLLGLSGSITGGLLMSLAIFIIYIYEKKASNKLADKLTNELKAVYTERLLNTKATIKTTGKYN